MFGRKFDFCRNEFLRLCSESIDPCDESLVFRDEKEALLNCDDEREYPPAEDLRGILFASVYFFDIVSATLRSLFFRVDISR
jgi:hypothetical protein